MVQRQTEHQRPEAEPLSRLRDGSEEHRLLRRHTQMRAVVLGEVVASKAPAFGELDELQTVPIELLQRYPRDPLDVVENPELDWHSDLSFHVYDA
jgi:hypothetical protein